jgi:glutathione S-transferase
MIRLCGFRISNYHNKVRIALLEKGVPHEEDDSVKPSQDEKVLARSPMGKVPFLEVDGTCLRESNVILEYLEDA